MHRFKLDCGWHPADLWTKDVTAAEKAALVRAFVGAALAGQEPLPP
ncbi:hypothetical protein [Streptomyces sp. NBC_00443]